MIAIQCTTCETVSPLPEWNRLTGGCPVCNVEFYADPSTQDKMTLEVQELKSVFMDLKEVQPEADWLSYLECVWVCDGISDEIYELAKKETVEETR